MASRHRCGTPLARTPSSPARSLRPTRGHSHDTLWHTDFDLSVSRLVPHCSRLDAHGCTGGGGVSGGRRGRGGRAACSEAGTGTTLSVPPPPIDRAADHGYMALSRCCCQAPPHPALALPHTCLILHYYTASWSTGHQMAPPEHHVSASLSRTPWGRGRSLPCPADAKSPQPAFETSPRFAAMQKKEEKKSNKQNPSFGLTVKQQPVTTFEGKPSKKVALKGASESNPKKGNKQTNALGSASTPNAQERKCKIRLGLNLSLVGNALPHKQSRM